MKLQFKRRIDFILGNFLVGINLVAAKTLGFLLRRNHSIKEEPSTIIFMKMLGLGSVFLASNAILAVKKRYPQAKLILITGSGIKPGLSPIGLFDEIWEIRDKNFTTLLMDSISVLFKTWKRKKLWVADLEVYSKLTTVFSLWTFAINRFGFYLTPVWFRWNINTHNVYFNQFVIVEENYQRLAEEMGAPLKERYSFPGFDLSERKHEHALPFIAINNTCSELGRERICAPEVLAEVCKWLLVNTTYRLAFTGAPSDKEDNEKFIQNYLPDTGPERVFSVAGKYNFAEYYQFLFRQCAMMITVDTGPLHFARKLNVPTISLWGPTHPESRIKTDSRNQVYYLAKSCSPCVHYTDVLPCGGNNICMKDMDPQQIILLIKTMITTITN